MHTILRLHLLQIIAMDKIKIYCIFSQDAIKEMKGIRGKLAAQAGHAYLHAYWNAAGRFPDIAEEYKESSHAYKIACVVNSTEMLSELYNQFCDTHGVTVVEDAGFTVFENPTVTCIGIGPIREEDVGPLAKLSLLK